MVKYVKRSIFFVLICAVVLTGIPVVNTESRKNIDISVQAEARVEIEWDNNMIIVDGRSEGIDG